MPRLELDHRLQHGDNDLLLLLLLLDVGNHEWGQIRRHELLLQQLLLLNICPLSLSQLREVGLVLPILTFLPVSTPLPNVFPRRLHTHIRPKPRDPHKTIFRARRKRMYNACCIDKNSESSALRTRNRKNTRARERPQTREHTHKRTYRAPTA